MLLSADEQAALGQVTSMTPAGPALSTRIVTTSPGVRLHSFAWPGFG